DLAPSDRDKGSLRINKHPESAAPNRPRFRGLFSHVATFPTPPVSLREGQLMEWCGRAPAPRANNAWMGRPTKEYRDVQQIKFDRCHDGHRNRQERAPCRPPPPCAA